MYIYIYTGYGTVSLPLRTDCSPTDAAPELSITPRHRKKPHGVMSQGLHLDVCLRKCSWAEMAKMG